MNTRGLIAGLIAIGVTGVAYGQDSKANHEPKAIHNPKAVHQPKAMIEQEGEVDLAPAPKPEQTPVFPKEKEVVVVERNMIITEEIANDKAAACAFSTVADMQAHEMKFESDDLELKSEMENDNDYKFKAEGQNFDYKCEIEPDGELKEKLETADLEFKHKVKEDISKVKVEGNDYDFKIKDGEDVYKRKYENADYEYKQVTREEVFKEKMEGENFELKTKVTDDVVKTKYESDGLNWKIVEDNDGEKNIRYVSDTEKLNWERGENGLESYTYKFEDGNVEYKVELEEDGEYEVKLEKDQGESDMDIIDKVNTRIDDIMTRIQTR